MESKLVALISMCLFLPLPATSAQNKMPFKEIEMPSRKLLLLATGPVLPVAHDGATEHRRPSSGDSFWPRLLLVTLPSLCVIVFGILCRLRGPNPQTQNAELATPEALRPNITYNFIGSCLSVN